jgi:hypothetical protein
LKITHLSHARCADQDIAIFQMSSTFGDPAHQL